MFIGSFELFKKFKASSFVVTPYLRCNSSLGRYCGGLNVNSRPTLDDSQVALGVFVVNQAVFPIINFHFNASMRTKTRG